MVRNDMENDNELIKKYQKGDQLAFEKIVRNHLSDTIGFFFTITRDKMVAEDLAQDVFFKLYKSLKKFRFQSSFSTFLYRVNLNTANTWFTSNKWKDLLRLDQTPDRGERDTTVEDEWYRRELWDEIGKLPNKQRSVVMMRIAEELSYKEISDITGMTEGTAKVNYHHALKTLKKRVKDA